jgi:glycosyltransferase involved in cell wall biosynthesis
VSDLSVVIPAHNASRYLRATLDSMAAQQVSPKQVIVVDDGSTDDTAEIARTYEMPSSISLVLVQNPHPLGVAAARNAGVALVTAEWVGLCDRHPSRRAPARASGR